MLHDTHRSRFNPGGHPLAVGDKVTVGHQVVLQGCHIADRCLIYLEYAATHYVRLKDRHLTAGETSTSGGSGVSNR